MKTLIVIPARFASTRFPGKPLVEIEGKSMICRVVEQALKVKSADRVLVATDDERIFRHVENAGFEVRMTRADHVSGSDRVAEISSQLPDFQLVINVQGDEPFIQPEQIEGLISFLKNDESLEIGTLAKRISRAEDLFNPNVVKVVFSEKTGRAFYFSRSAIPFLRGIESEKWLAESRHFRHVGLYGFRREILGKLAGLPPSQLELAESLEQLRWLENGFSIGVCETEFESVGIDSPEDLKRLYD